MSHTKAPRKPSSQLSRAKARGSHTGRSVTPGKSITRIVLGKSPSVGTGGPEGVNVIDLRRNLGISQEELARITGYSTRSIAGWESGQQLSPPAKQKLTETQRLCTALAEFTPSDTLGPWLRTPNPAFEGQSPIQILERGEADRLWQMIFQIDANVAN